ncbi:hypothetical protein ACFFMR_29285 [Micromonospora andamanensis]|uniref:Uncharacterized protein n=1 Tax=Micromonospora andamanensis TaxID=1287068 RepID=A0ABQ4HS01_9ACTN|nr:hypothetical protein [Micromonospora andamanensis]GIJ08416.1 hypothetical protein Van01_16300 [Micromonospora andamanensis]
MSGITEAINDLALQVGATVNWTALHNNLQSPAVAALISAAATVEFNTGLIQRHQQDLNHVLDAARTNSGTPEDQLLIASALANMSLSHLDERQASVDRVRALVIPLAELGVLELPM